MIRNCTPQGNPLPPLRNWYDPWTLVGEMIAFTIGAVVILTIDVCAHFIGALHRDDIIHDFKQRVRIAYTTVPFYLQQLKIAETYNKEVKKHGIQTDKGL